MKYDKILIPVDFSEESIEGLATAISLSEKLKAKIHLLHVIDESSPSQLQETGDVLANNTIQMEHDLYVSQLVRKRGQELKYLAKQFENKEIEVQTSVGFGRFQDALEKYVDEHQIDLVVMGTSGETSFTELFKGNHAARAMRGADVPVLVLKDGKSFDMNGNRLLLLVDLKDYQSGTVQNIRNFADALSMKVLIAHVRQKSDLTSESPFKVLEAFARKHKFENYSLHIIGHGEKIEQISDFISKWDIDVTASISEGDGGLIRLFFGSDTEKFIQEIDQPMLVVSEE